MFEFERLKVGCGYAKRVELQLPHFTHGAFSQAHPLRLDPFALSSHLEAI